MKHEAAMQQEQQHALTKSVQQGVDRDARRALAQQVDRHAAEGRERIYAAGGEIARRTDNIVEDARDSLGPEVGTAAKQLMDHGREIMDQVEQAAAAFFAIVQASLERGAEADGVMDAATQASRAMEQFASEMHRQEDEMSRAMGQALDAGHAEQAREALERSAAESERIKEDLGRELTRLSEAIEQGRVEELRQQEARDGAERDQRRRDAERTADRG